MLRKTEGHRKSPGLHTSSVRVGRLFITMGSCRLRPCTARGLVSFYVGRRLSVAGLLLLNVHACLSGMGGKRRSVAVRGFVSEHSARSR